MSKRNLSEGEITELLKNRNIAKCSEKAITYSKDFKVAAVRQYNEEGLTSTEIFTMAGFDLHIIGKDTPNDRIGDWVQIAKAKGMEGLCVETRGRAGGRPEVKGLTDAEKIKWLEAKVAYLKAENDFLAKLRAKKAE